MWPMSTSLIRRMTVPVLAGGLLVAVGCSQQNGDLMRYGPVDHAAVTQAKGVSPETTIDTTGDDRPGLLMGPHFKVQLGGFTVADSVPADQAALYGFSGGPVRAENGTEFFLAIVAADTTGGDKGVRAALDVDGTERPLDHVPTAGEAVAAVVPTGAKVALSVFDEDRGQSVNLRDGSRIKEIDGYYNGALRSEDPKDYSESGKATGDAGANYLPVSRTLHIKMNVGVATRDPWDDELGWADEGKVWVTVPISDMVTDSVWGFDTGKNSHEPIMTWKLKERDTFSLTPKDGKAVDPKGKQTFTADDTRELMDDKGYMTFDPNGTDLVFQVTAKATSMTLRITPKGSMKAKWADVSGKCTWDSKPDTGKISLKF